MDGEIWVLVPIATLAMFGFIAWVVYRTKVENRSAEVTAGLHSKMIEKFGSSEEFVGFLRTEDGKRYLTSFTERPASNPAEKVVNTAKTGVILTMLSLGLMMAGAVTEIPLNDNPAAILGLVGIFLGFGFLISAFVGHKISRVMKIYGNSGEND